MPPISSKKTLALALAISTALSGCTSTTLGYVKDHPDPVALSPDYGAVKTWAYGVSDGYSSRGTMNRYSIYWGAAIAAAGIGALGGLAVTGSSGNASIVIPLTTTFIGTLFGYYHNEEQAQVYYSASDSINAFINRSEKRLNLPGKKNLISELSKIIKNDLDSATMERNEQVESKNKLPQDVQSLGNPNQNTISADTIAALGKAVDVANTKIAEAQRKIDLANKRQQNLDLLINSGNSTAYEAGCLSEDVDDVMHRVRVHLSLLDPQHVSEDLKHIKASVGKTDNDPPSATPSTSFDLSDLDPKKIVSACDVGL
jgi:hypothetical protein